MRANISPPEWDVIVVGAGPAGSVCAAVCASAGLKTLVIERSRFPRDKVCGDCLNPLAWPVLERLDLRERVDAIAHSKLRTVEFVACDGETVRVPLPSSDRGEIAIRRRDLDMVLLERATELGADVHQETAVSSIRRIAGGWHLQTSEGQVTGRLLVAADGRNSTVARLLELMPKARRDRVSIQTHLPLPPGLRDTVRMQFLPEGYSGIADIGDERANLCLVARPENLDRLRARALDLYNLAEDQEWRSITPLSRNPISAAHDGVLLVGDAARVVEPFTGEGIAYAMRSGALAADSIVHDRVRTYAAQHAALYRGRLWLNKVAKFACLHPGIASRAVHVARAFPAALNVLTQMVIRSVPPAAAIRRPA
jgi:geranylgeranyl reductase family protein